MSGGAPRPDNIEITGYRPGALGRIVELHGSYYHQHWGFDVKFEAEVARELAEFLLRFDAVRDGLWLALARDRVAGSIVIDGGGDPQSARLRWFVIEPALQGRGLGRRMLAEALAFCRRRRLARVHLDTFAGLDAARRLYEAQGFRLVGEHRDDDWGPPVTHQTFELLL